MMYFRVKMLTDRIAGISDEIRQLDIGIEENQGRQVNFVTKTKIEGKSSTYLQKLSENIRLFVQYSRL